MKTSRSPTSSNSENGTSRLGNPARRLQALRKCSYECPVCQTHFSETVSLRIPAQAPWYRLQRIFPNACPHCHAALRWQALPRSRPRTALAQSISLGLLTGLVFTLPFFGVTALRHWFPDFDFNTYYSLILLWFLALWGYPDAPAHKAPKGEAGVFLPAAAAPENARGFRLYLLSALSVLAVLTLCPPPALPITWLTLVTLSFLLSIASLVAPRVLAKSAL